MRIVGWLLIIAVAIFWIPILFAVGNLPLLFVWAWAGVAIWQYRVCRQEELAQLLATLVGTGAPLVPGLRAALEDRPRGGLRDLWLATIWLFLLPGYYFFWKRHYSFEARLARLIDELEKGLPLHQALAAQPALAPRVTVLAAALGHSTGQLPRCLNWSSEQLRGSPRSRLAEVLFYPWGLVAFTIVAALTIMEFLTYFIAPKYMKIFTDYGADLPATTAAYMAAVNASADYLPVLVLGLLPLTVGIIVVWRRRLLWHIPVVGELYRMHVRSYVLHLLAMLFEAGRPVPEALRLLAAMPFAKGLRRRLERTRTRIENGQPLAEAMCDTGLLTTAMAPLLKTAEKASNLPWAMRELAYWLRHRYHRRAQRLSAVMFPVVLSMVAALVAFVVLAFYWPLVRLIQQMAW